MTITDRSGAVSSDVAVKLPVRCATTANIALSGTPTLDDIVTVVDDRVLVKDQTDSEENGIYDIASGAWTRSADVDDAYSLLEGTLVFVLEGTANGEQLWQQTTADPVIGDTAITWESIAIAGPQGPTGAAGADGADGAAGADGADGAAGAAVLTGQTEPLEQMALTEQTVLTVLATVVRLLRLFLSPLVVKQLPPRRV